MNRVAHTIFRNPSRTCDAKIKPGASNPTTPRAVCLTVFATRGELRGKRNSTSTRPIRGGPQWRERDQTHRLDPEYRGPEHHPDPPAIGSHSRPPTQLRAAASCKADSKLAVERASHAYKRRPGRFCSHLPPSPSARAFNNIVGIRSGNFSNILVILPGAIIALRRAGGRQIGDAEHIRRSHVRE